MSKNRSVRFVSWPWSSTAWCAKGSNLPRASSRRKKPWRSWEKFSAIRCVSTKRNRSRGYQPSTTCKPQCWRVWIWKNRRKTLNWPFCSGKFEAGPIQNNNLRHLVSNSGDQLEQVELQLWFVTWFQLVRYLVECPAQSNAICQKQRIQSIRQLRLKHQQLLKYSA